MSTYIELVNRAEAAASAAEQSALNTANNKTIVQGLLSQMQGIVANTATLPIPSIQVNPSTGIVTAEYTATAGNVLSSTQRIGTLDISSLLGSGQVIATEFYKCASVSAPYTESHYVVSGAGTSEVNGNYTDTGTTNDGKPVYSYTNNGTTYYLFYDTGSGATAWYINTSTSLSDYSQVMYATYSASPVDDIWYTGNNGSGNPPTVTLMTETHVPKTWTGYKAVKDPITGIYSFENTVTNGLTYGGGFTPVVNGIYTDGALVKVSEVYMGWEPPAGAVFYAPLNASAATAETGHILTANNVSFNVVGGIPCAVFAGNENSYIYTTDGTGLPISNATSSISCWIRFNTLGAYNSWVVAYGSGSTNALRGVFAHANTNYAASGLWGPEGDNLSNTIVNINTWYHFVATFTNEGQQLYLNGQLISNSNYNAMDTVFEKLSIGGYFTSGGTTLGEYADCCVAAVRVYSRALTSDEITVLGAEFTPTVA